MSLPRVWAPLARSVELERGGQRQAMQQTRGGWWQAQLPLAHGEDYAFVVDGDGPFPDPRSPWQPQGVHGPSRHLDHTRFIWHDGGWRAPPLACALIYELHVGTFTAEGSFDGAISRLDALVELGVTHVELMPVNAFPGRHGWGYDGAALYAPHQPYGGPDALKRLVAACHARGLAVLLDVVYNHLGPDGNYLARFGPYFTRRYATPWGEAVNLDGADSDEVRRFFIDNALMWLSDYHFDGLRVDAVHAIVDQSARHFLEQLTAEVRALEAPLRRPLVVIAESDLNDPRLLRPPEAGGYGMDAQWSDDFHHSLHALLTGERAGYYADFGAVGDIAAALTRRFVYDGRYSAFRRRRHGRPALEIPAERFLGYLQNHDQVGNRARGERIGALVSRQRLMIAAALVLTAPFVPLLFQGEEWNASAPFLYFTDHQDPRLGAAVRDGRRAEFAAFGWDPASIPDPQAEDSFRRSRLDWSERRHGPHAQILDWYRRLIALRRAHPDLAAGAPADVQYDEGARWLVCVRGSIVVACNFAASAQQLPLPPAQGHEVLLSSEESAAPTNQTVRLAAESVALLRRAAFTGDSS